MGNSRSQSTLSTGQKAPSAKRCIKTATTTAGSVAAEQVRKH